MTVEIDDANDMHATSLYEVWINIKLAFWQQATTKFSTW